MIRLLVKKLSLWLAALACLPFGSVANAGIIDWVPVGLSSPQRTSRAPSDESNSLGFRLAAPVAVPEPSTYAMAFAGLACGGWQMFRRRRAR